MESGCSIVLLAVFFQRRSSLESELSQSALAPDSRIRSWRCSDLIGLLASFSASVLPSGVPVNLPPLICGIAAIEA